MSGRDRLRAQQAASHNGRVAGRFEVLFEDGKLILPELPAHDDTIGLCAWLTAVFNLNTAHSITTGRREGLFGPEAHVVLKRADAPDIRFEPATKINAPTKLLETLSWRMINIDGAVHALKGEHCRQIAHVVRMLCGATQTMTDAEEADAIIGTFLAEAIPVEAHTTYGTTQERFGAALALRRDLDPATGRPTGPHHYLIDKSTGELVIPVGALAEAARRHIGSSVPRGWLDGRMETLEWKRLELDGHAQAGRDGRLGQHARLSAYRGHQLRHDDDETATT